MFDRILLMAEGRTAFLGPVGQTMSFFSSQGLPCPPNYNPADFFIHTLATIPGQEIESKKRSKEICDAFDASEFGHQVMVQVEANRPTNLDLSPDATTVQVRRSPYKANWFAQFGAVMWRSFLSVIRNPAVLKVKAFQTVVFTFNLLSFSFPTSLVSFFFAVDRLFDRAHLPRTDARV